MRIFRVIAGLVTLAVLATLSPAVVTSATAAPVASSASALAKQNHDVVDEDSGVRRGRYYISGQVKTYTSKRIYLRKAKCRTCAYKPFESERTTRRGRYEFRFLAPRGSFLQVVVPSTRRYKTYRSFYKIS